MFAKFHVAKHVHEAVERVRKAEHRALTQAGSDMRPHEMTPEPRRTARTLRQGELKVARAWARKQRLRQLWPSRHREVAQRFFARWFGRATHSAYLRHGTTNASLEAVNAV